MLTGKYRRIYYNHLKKCGGSTLNHWLDTLTCDERAFNSLVWGAQVIDRKADDTQTVIVPRMAKSLFYWSDVVHSHGPLRMYAPENTFCFTVLRDPVQRLVSQISDWRRLSDADTTDRPTAVRECVEDSRRLRLRDFLEKHAHLGGRRFLDNYMTRALAAGRVGNLINHVPEAARLEEVALQTLQCDYDVVGLTEHLDLSRNAVCAMIGLPPARQIPTINVSRMPGQPDPEIDEARDLLEELTKIDRAIHDRARQLFDQRHRKPAEAYDTVAFENDHAATLLSETRGHFCDRATRFSVRAPIIGSGFHGRDGAGLPACAVWSGPGTSTTLYIATPPNMALSLLVWIRGYADPAQREQLRVRVDGSPAAHHFGYASGYADVLTVDTRSTRGFIRLEIDLDQTLESGEPGSPQHDARKRGFAFDSYGWRPAL